MPIYHCHQCPFIDRVEVITPRHGIWHAAIFVRENISGTELDELRHALGEKSLSTMMDTKDGRAVIQVRGIKKESILFEALESLGLWQHQMQKVETSQDEKKSGFFEQVRSKSMYLSSVFYNLGNAAFIGSGIQRARHNKGGKFTSNDVSELMIGGAFFAGDLLMMGYGHDKGDEELHIVDRSLRRHLRQKGIMIPEGDALTPESLHDSGAFKTVHHWLHRHIGRIKCLAETAGGLFTIHAGMKLDHAGKRNNGKLLAGLLLTTGWFSTFLLEKPRGSHILNGSEDYNGKPKSPSPFQAILDNPRLIAGPMSAANNISNLVGSYGERGRLLDHVRQAEEALRVSPTSDARAHLAFTKAKQFDYVWNVFSACSFLVANGLFGLSGSKKVHETDDDKVVMNDLVLLSSNVLASVPEKTRDVAINDTAEYVSTLAGVDVGKDEVAAAIRSKIEGLSKSAWANRVQAETLLPAPQR